MIELDPASKIYIASLVGEAICQTLQSAASLVPGIGVASTTALLLVQSVQTVERNKEDFRDLAKGCCLIMATLAEKVDPQNGSEPTYLQEDAAQIHNGMKFIEKCVKKYGKKQSFWKGMWIHYPYKRAIKQCRGHLRDALNMHSLKSDIELQEKAAVFLDDKVKPPSQQEAKDSLEHPTTDNDNDPSSSLFQQIRGLNSPRRRTDSSSGSIELTNFFNDGDGGPSFAHMGSPRRVYVV